MKKIALVLGILLVSVIVLPAMAVPPEPQIPMKVSGGGWYESYEDIKWTKAFTAQMDSSGNVKGEWQARSSAPGPGTWHADVTYVETGIFESGSQAGKTGALIVGVVTSADDPSMVGDTECMLLVDNGQGNAAPDQIMGGYNGDGDYCLALYRWGAAPWKDFQGNIQITLPSF